MPVSAQRFKGKLKREIANEAFQKIGAAATIQQVDAYFLKNYGLPTCERSMYSAARRQAAGLPMPIPRRYRRNKEAKKDMADIIIRLKQLVYDIGSWNELEELIKAIK